MQIQALIDELAAVNAQIDALKADAERIKGELFTHGAGTYQSERYRAVVTAVAESTTVNFKKVAEYLAQKVSDAVYRNAVKNAQSKKDGYFRVALNDLNA